MPRAKILVRTFLVMKVFEQNCLYLVRTEQGPSGCISSLFVGVRKEIEAARGIYSALICDDVSIVKGLSAWFPLPK